MCTQIKSCVTHTRDAKAIHCLTGKYHHLFCLLIIIRTFVNTFTRALQICHTHVNTVVNIIQSLKIHLHVPWLCMYLQLKIIWLKIRHLELLPWMTTTGIVGDIQTVKKLFNFSQKKVSKASLPPFNKIAFETLLLITCMGDTLHMFI